MHIYFEAVQGSHFEPTGMPKANKALLAQVLKMGCPFPQAKVRGFGGAPALRFCTTTRGVKIPGKATWPYTIGMPFLQDEVVTTSEKMMPARKQCLFQPPSISKTVLLSFRISLVLIQY